jgi:hypothetical protein
MHLPGQSVSPGGGVIGEHFAGYRGALGRVLLLSFYVFPLFRENSRVCVFKSPSDTQTGEFPRKTDMRDMKTTVVGDEP